MMTLGQLVNETISEAKTMTRKRYKSANQMRKGLHSVIERLPIVPMKVNLEQVIKLNEIYMELMKLIKQRDYINVFNKCSQWWDTTVDNNLPLLNVSGVMKIGC